MSEIPMDLTLSTQQALSVTPSPGRGGSGAPEPTAARLRVAVSPRAGRIGRRTRYVLRVTAGGRPVQGAAVRFAGRSARTGRAGTATMVRTFLRPGPRRVAAAKAGFRRGRVAFRVSRRGRE